MSASRHAVAGEMSRDLLFCTLGDTLQGFCQNVGEAGGQWRGGDRLQHGARLDLTGLTGGGDSLFLGGDPRVDFGIGRELEEVLYLDALREESFNYPLRGPGFALLVATLQGEPFFVLRESDALAADDDAVEITLVVDLDDVPRVDVLGNKGTVKDSDLGDGPGPRSGLE